MPLVVDWEPLLKYPESTVTCRCGAVYRSHAKCVAANGTLHRVTRKPCPACGASQDHTTSIRSDPETYTL